MHEFSMGPKDLGRELSRMPRRLQRSSIPRPCHVADLSSSGLDRGPVVLADHEGTEAAKWISLVTAANRTLENLLPVVQASIADPLLRDIVITRIFIRTGVNLREIRPEQNTNPSLVAEISRTFGELGYPLLEVTL